jgi:hypothetical protein
MYAIEFVVVLAFRLVGYFMLILLFVNDAVASQSVSGDGGSGLNIVENEGLERKPCAIQGDMQTNATHSLFNVSTFDGNRHNGFTFSSPASFAGALTTNEKLIDFNTARELFTP